MKKVLFGFIIGMLVCIGFQTMASTVNVFKAEKAGFDILVNGEKFSNTDKPAVVIDGSTYLPLRSMGNALSVPVEWNTELKRVEVGKTIKPTINANELKIKSNTFNFNSGGYPVMPIVFSKNKCYVALEVFRQAGNIDVENENNTQNIYFKLSNKEPILIKQGNTVTDKAINVNGLTYIDIEACGLKYTIAGDTLWAEM